MKERRVVFAKRKKDCFTRLIRSFSPHWDASGATLTTSWMLRGIFIFNNTLPSPLMRIYSVAEYIFRAFLSSVPLYCVFSLKYIIRQMKNIFLPNIIER